MKWTIDSNTGDVMSEQSKIASVYGTTENMRNARLIAAAPEMYKLMCELKRIDNLKAKATREENDTLFAKALLAQDEAFNKARELIAHIDGKNEVASGE